MTLRITRGQFCTSLLGIAGLAACGKDSSDAPPPPPPPGAARFAIISDPHVYDAATLGDGNEALGTGDALNAYIAGDRKMIRQSAALLDAAVADLAREDLDFLLVAGDLTKDGERASHELFARKLSGLRQAGVAVIVVPGNHDVNNPESFAYRADGSRAPAPNVTPSDFERIHADNGYAQAFSRDETSLSYAVEPVSGLVVLAVDSCKYEDNATRSHSQTGGAIRASTLTWIEGVAQAARSAGKRVIAVQHHGVAEHYQGQAQLFAEYLVDEYLSVARAYAAAGVSVVFTGHYHANDAAAAPGGVALTDVETGSLVTSPSPYRLVNVDLEAGTLAIHTSRVSAIAPAAYPSDRYASFPAFASKFLSDGMVELAKGMIVQQFQPYVDAQTAALIAPFVADAMVAHYAGDESPRLVEASAIQTLVSSLSAGGAPAPVVATLQGFLGGLWTDLPPGDNDLTLALP